ncbi:MAG: hypothetical protein GF350_01210 [Chitinivibrionales bacterium]|nr:hypothetical protein [Chitinivibrionales bacterium]
MKTCPQYQKGVTLLGLLLAVVLGGIILLGLMRVFMTSVKSYSAEEKLIEMKRSTNRTINKIKEFFMEAGVDLPEDEDVITFDGDYVIIKVNRTGAYHCFDEDVDSDQIPVEDARGFIGYESIWRKTPGDAAAQVTIDISKNTSPFEKGIDTTNHVLYLTTTESFVPDDELYAYKTYKFRHDPTTNTVYVTIDGYEDVLAENIEEFFVKFYDTHRDAKTEQTDWADMRVCSLFVKGITDSRVSAGTGSGEFKEMSLSKIFYLRNKIPIGG